MILRLAARLARDLALIPLTAFLVYQGVALLPLGGVDEDGGKTKLPADIVEQLRDDLGLQDRFTTGFLRPWQKLAAGERIGRGAQQYDARDLLRALAGSLRIGAMGLGLALALAAVYAVARVSLTGRRGDEALDLVPTLVYGTPSFIVALLIALRTGISIGGDSVSFEPVAAAVVGLGPGVFLGAVLHDALRTEMARPYVLAALARGRSPLGAVVAHALPNAVPAMLDALPPVATALLAGSFVAEKLFNLSYFGLFYVNAAQTRQLGLVVVGTTVFAALLILVSLAVELLRVAVDPKARSRAVESVS